MNRNLARRGAFLLLAGAAWLVSLHSARAQHHGSSCATCETGFYCQTHHCPPHLSHCMEGPPRIHIKIGCPRPICNPCSQPGWGYYETCWTPWPWPPNYSHCPTVPPAATVALSGPITEPYRGLLDANPTTTVPSIVPGTPMIPTLPPASTIPQTPVPPVPQTFAPRPTTMVPAIPAARPTIIIEPEQPLETLPVPRQDPTAPRPRLIPNPTSLDGF